MIEVRKDPIFNRRVSIISEVRAFRPKDFIEGKKPLSDYKNCPFCKGNEHMTPPARLILREDMTYSRDIDPERERNWLVRIIPNKYPALEPKSELVNKGSYGYHEVIIEAPGHNLHPPDLNVRHIYLLFKSIVKRMNQISKDTMIKYILLFRNYGHKGGASLYHPHSQLVAYTFVPPEIEYEAQVFKTFYEKRGCPYCELLSLESESPRVVYEDENYLIITTWAPRVPFELTIIPKEHNSTFLELDESSLKDFSAVFKSILSSIKIGLNDPSYNLWFHIAPLNGEHKYYHWHAELLPVLSTWAGVEKGSGVYIVSVSPERAAEYLKKFIEIN